MKREFLQNFKVGEAPLPPEVIDAIMAENGRDIEAAKKPFADYDTIKNQLSDAQKTIKGFQDQGADIETVRKSARAWEDKYNQTVEEHRKQLADMAFDTAVQEAVSKAHGRSAAAILGVLGAEMVETLKGSKNQAQDIADALEALKKENGYLFDDGRVPPPYSPGTGGINPKPGAEPANLADALRAKYNMN